MWCPTCRADVAAELSTDNRRMLCARCQSELGVAAGAVTNASPRTVEAERDARELLARWSANHLLEPAAPRTAAESLGKLKISTDLPSPRLPTRFDLSHPGVPAPTGRMIEAAIDTSRSSSIFPLSTGTESLTPSMDVGSRAPQGAGHGVDSTIPPAEVNSADHSSAAHGSIASSVTDNHDHIVREALSRPVQRRSALVILAGQICAYLGVGLLTCGTVMVMWSYFGGPTSYMPTGWLTAAIGQMLLFLGVITLISGGMEQTVSEVSWRIDHLAEEVHHLGLALDDLEHEHRQGRMHRTLQAHREVQSDGLSEAA